jgi:hypothetical protein
LDKTHGKRKKERKDKKIKLGLRTWLIKHRHEVKNHNIGNSDQRIEGKPTAYNLNISSHRNRKTIEKLGDEVGNDSKKNYFK